MKTLDKLGINTVVRQNEQGIICGITYDHQTKCVFNGSAFGKQYTAQGMLDRCGVGFEQLTQKQKFVKQSNSQNLPVSPESEFDSHVSKKEDMGILETLLYPQYTSAYVPNHCR